MDQWGLEWWELGFGAIGGYGQLWPGLRHREGPSPLGPPFSEGVLLWLEEG